MNNAAKKERIIRWKARLKVIAYDLEARLACVRAQIDNTEKQLKELEANQ